VGGVFLGDGHPTELAAGLGGIKADREFRGSFRVSSLIEQG
jgi:hypothetical protein